MSYAELDYASVQALTKEKGLNARGTKEELIERLTIHDNGGQIEATSEPTPTPTPAGKVTEKEVQQALQGDAQRTKAHLDSQRKVSVMIPLDPGVDPRSAELVPFTININGYRLSIKRGVFVEVPEQVANMVKARLETEGKIGAGHKIENDPKKVEALG